MASGFGGRYQGSVVDDADPLGEHRLAGAMLRRRYATSPMRDDFADFGTSDLRQS